MLTLTQSAVDAVDTLLHSNPEVPDEAGLRIGSAGESQLTIGIAPSPTPGDHIIEEGGARVFVDSAAAQLLDNAQLTAQMDGNEIAFGLSQASSENGAPPAY